MSKATKEMQMSTEQSGVGADNGSQPFRSVDPTYVHTLMNNRFLAGKLYLG